LVVRSGKYRIGYKLAMKALRNGQSKLLIISNNCPAIRKTQLEYMAILANSDVIHYEGNNVELGTALGRLHRVCVMSIQDPGDSDILTTVGKQ
jgi:large subunit ribosomal protein L30e